MEAQNTFGILFGCLAPTITEQFKIQKLNFTKDKAKQFEKSRQAILQLWLDDVLNDSEAKKAQKKLFTKIKAHINSKNKEAR